MNLKESSFRYSSVLKIEQDIQLEAFELFPALHEISFQSRVFTQYAECVKSCKGLMEDMTKGINISLEAPKFKVGAEVNPEHTGNQTLSKDWGPDEVARFWVYDKAMEGNGKAINAICKASIFAIPKEVSPHTVN
jgi:hypothetical protein